jgi:hypothetical protein
MRESQGGVAYKFNEIPFPPNICLISWHNVGCSGALHLVVVVAGQDEDKQ